MAGTQSLPARKSVAAEALDRTPPSPESSTRQSLLMRVRDLSDSGAWREFVGCYAPRVFGWCRTFGLQAADAADATQLVLMKLVEHLQRFEYDPQQGRFRGWLKTVSRHAAADVARQWRERGLGLLPAESGLESLAADQLTPADQLYEAIRQAWREELLRLAEESVSLRVQPATWQAWRLCCREGRPAPEAARELGIDVSDVYVAKSRVLRLLREEVRRLDPDIDS